MKNMNPAIRKFNRMFETFDNEPNKNPQDRLQVLPIIFFGQNLLKMYPQLNDEFDSSEIVGRLRSLRMFCETYHIEITKTR